MILCEVCGCVQAVYKGNLALFTASGLPNRMRRYARRYDVDGHLALVREEPPAARHALASELSAEGRRLVRAFRSSWNVRPPAAFHGP